MWNTPTYKRQLVFGIFNKYTYKSLAAVLSQSVNYLIQLPAVPVVSLYAAARLKFYLQLIFFFLNQLSFVCSTLDSTFFSYFSVPVN